MPTDQEERRRALRKEVRKVMSAKINPTGPLIGSYELIEWVTGLLLDQIADLQGKVKELERRLNQVP